MNSILKLIFFILVIILFAILLIVLGSRWHISDPDCQEWVVKFHFCTFLKEAWNIHLLDLPKIVIKEKLGVSDALINLLALFVTGAPMIILSFLFFGLGSIILILIGLFTGSWDNFLIGLLCILFTILAPILLCLFMFILWLLIRLLFQPCTPGYVVIWLLIGLPVIISSIGAIAALIYEGEIILVRIVD